MTPTLPTEHTDWRIEFDFDRPGAHHMQQDEELSRDYNGNVLRLYTWSPPALSLGFQQNIASIDESAATRLGVDVVRRPTGGRAVLHWNELTYSVILKSDPADGIYAVHNAIIGGLLASLRSLGPAQSELTLTSGTSDSGFREVYKPGTLTNAACFASSARHEVTWRAKKVIGSAQRRFGDVVLQHGSILLTTDHLRLSELVALPSTQRQRMHELLARETATLSDVFRRPITATEAAEAIASEFASNFELMNEHGSVPAATFLS
jgi:lipoate-protein ligase A